MKRLRQLLAVSIAGFVLAAGATVAGVAAPAVASATPVQIDGGIEDLCC